MSIIVPPTTPQQDDDERFCGVCLAGVTSSEHQEKCVWPLEGLEDAFSEARRILGLVLHLRMNGERAPGGDETWEDCDYQVENFLRTTDGAA